MPQTVGESMSFAAKTRSLSPAFRGSQALFWYAVIVLHLWWASDLIDSGLDYDRSPIVVLVNECALPARGERTLDGVDIPKARRHHHHPKESRSTTSTGDAHGHNALATRGSVELSSYNLAAISSSVPSLVHADSSDSDDGVALPIDDRGVQVYRHPLAPDLNRNLLVGAANPVSQSRRLRKSPPAHAHGRMASHETRNSSTESFSTFSPWSGGNSCLGGF